MVRVFLRLVDLGAISGRADARAGGAHPQDARPAGERGTSAPVSDGRRGEFALGPVEGPTVYNMGPSIHRDTP
jgi:hypothetical protein